jgi:Carbohydrate binding module (family 6)
MTYCATCKRYLNGALSCAGCGTVVGETDGQPTMPLPPVRLEAPPPSLDGQGLAQGLGQGLDGQDLDVQDVTTTTLLAAIPAPALIDEPGPSVASAGSAGPAVSVASVDPSAIPPVTPVSAAAVAAALASEAALGKAALGKSAMGKSAGNAAGTAAATTAVSAAATSKAGAKAADPDARNADPSIQPRRRKNATRVLIGGSAALVIVLGVVIASAATGGQVPKQPSTHDGALGAPGAGSAVLTLPAAAGSTSGRPSASARPSVSATPSDKTHPSASATPSATASSTPTPTSSPTVNGGAGATTNAPSKVAITASQYSSTNNTQNEATQDIGGGDDVGWIENGSWLEYAGVNFGNGLAGSLQARIASTVQGNDFGSIQFRLDSLSATPFATIRVSGTGGWQNWVTSSATTSPIPSGTHNLYVTFADATGGDFVNVNWFQIT